MFFGRCKNKGRRLLNGAVVKDSFFKKIIIIIIIKISRKMLLRIGDLATLT
jgi:hypothetical protein